MTGKGTRPMSMTDPIADMLTRLRNTNSAFRESVSTLYSKLEAHIAEILEREGYITGSGVEEVKVGEAFTLNLKYGLNHERALAGLRRTSKPGLRIYAKSTSLPKVLGGLSVTILSTSSGLLTDREAKDRDVGGEVLVYVW